MAVFKAFIFLFSLKKSGIVTRLLPELIPFAAPYNFPPFGQLSLTV